MVGGTVLNVEEGEMMIGWLLINIGIILGIPLLLIINGTVVATLKTQGDYFIAGWLLAIFMFIILIISSLIVWGIRLL